MKHRLFTPMTGVDLVIKLKHACAMTVPGQRMRVIASHLSYEADARPESQWALWRVIEIQNRHLIPAILGMLGHTPRYLTCTLIDERDGGCYFEEIEEAAFPLFFSCPPAFLELATHGRNDDWRRCVFDYHRSKQAA